jgi:hypothetical protein
MAKDVYQEADDVTSEAVADVYKLDQPEISYDDRDSKRFQRTLQKVKRQILIRAIQNPPAE